MIIELNIFISSTCKQPVIAIVATKIENSYEGNESIIKESVEFIKEQVYKYQNSQVYLYSEIIKTAAKTDGEGIEDIKTPSMLRELLAIFGTHFNEKKGFLVPFNWEEYSE